jgi:hypothetical protein
MTSLLKVGPIRTQVYAAAKCCEKKKKRKKLVIGSFPEIYCVLFIISIDVE